jgi:hypothetical protein
MSRAPLTVHVDPVDQTIREINEIWRQGGLNTVVAIGDYLIRVFYGGDLELAQSHNPTKGKALAELYDRVDELYISLHALRRAVPIAVQYRSLPRQLADGLTAGHHVELLPLRQIEQKISLARRAVDGAMTTKELRKEVRREQKPRGGGRPKLPEVLVLTGRMARTAHRVDVARLVKASAIKELDEGQRGRVMQNLWAVRALIEKIEDALAKR